MVINVVFVTESIRTSVVDGQFPAKSERSKSYDEGLDDYREGKVSVLYVHLLISSLSVHVFKNID